MQHTDSKSIFPDLAVGILSFLLAFPLFIIFHKLLPQFNWPWELDRILLFSLVLIFLLIMLRVFRMLIFIIATLCLVWLGYGSISGGYGFNDIYSDYKVFVYTLQQSPDPGQQVLLSAGNFSRNKKILAAINKDETVVRDFAVKATNEYFKKEQQQGDDYRKLVQYFAVFKKINNNWNYVNDPESREYFATAPESIGLMAGDCDDHSILMAAAIKSIGGIPRLVYTTGHVYPELLIGNKNDLEQVNYLIKKILFPKESKKGNIHYHEDDDGKIWLNLDYTARYPGGPYLVEGVMDFLYP